MKLMSIKIKLVSYNTSDNENHTMNNLLNCTALYRFPTKINYLIEFDYILWNYARCQSLHFPLTEFNYVRVIL